MKRSRLSELTIWITAVLAVLTAFCPFYFACFLMQQYVHLHQPFHSVLASGQDGLRDAGLYLVAAVLYVRFPAVRTLLLLCAVSAAGVGLAHVPAYWSFLQERNMFDNILAEPLWETCGRVLVAVSCMSQFVLTKLNEMHGTGRR